MRVWLSGFRFPLGAALGVGLLACASLVRGQVVPAASPPETLPIDLPTALRLAGAQNLDVKMAREKLSLAKANRDIAVQQFFPWLAPGVAYRRHDNRIQDTTGTILDVNKQSYTVGGALTAQVDLGEAWFRELAARQFVKAAGHALDAQREQTVWQAAQAYFDLAKAHAAVDITRDALRIATDYEGQLRNAVEAGIALKGDVLRAQVQAEQSRVALRNAQKEARVTAARLAQMLRLDSTVELLPPADELVPISLVSTNAKLGALVAQALASRPELKERQTLVTASQTERQGAVVGPLVPSVGAQVFVGGLGGGRGGSVGSFGDQETYFVGVGWRIGPGGLFDRARLRAADSRLNTSRLAVDKQTDDITREVVEAFTEFQAQGDQIENTRRALAAAQQALQLAKERKEFSVGVVLEHILAQVDYSRTRQDYVRAVLDFNKAQYTLRRVTGGTSGAGDQRK